MIFRDPKSDWYIPRDWRALLAMHLAIPLVCIATAFFIPLFNVRNGDTRLLWFSLIIGIIGVVLLFFARLPLYRQHKYFTFGPGHLPGSHKKLYWVAYGFIGTCIAILISILMILK